MDNSKKFDMNALVVDDNELNRLVLSNMLAVYGVHADQADLGSIAVDLCKDNPYEVIFIDHIMPEMDGIRTVQIIRSLSCNHKAVIIALSSEVTPWLREQFKNAGADDTYEKPLELTDIMSILERWYPEAPVDSRHSANANICYGNNELIQSIIETIEDIDYPTGLKYAANNPNLYIHILEVSLKDLQSCTNIIIKSFANNSVPELQKGFHKLCNIYSNIGAVRLTEEARQFEKDAQNIGMIELNDRYYSLMKHLGSLFVKIQNAIDNYHRMHITDDPEQGASSIPMSDKEYEQCLKKAIYYIRRYEYGLLVKEMGELIRRGFTEDRQELENALRDIMNYGYENASKALDILKNKTGAKPVSNP